MARHWNWDFEDEPAAPRRPPRPPAPEQPAHKGGEAAGAGQGPGAGAAAGAGQGPGAGAAAGAGPRAGAGRGSSAGQPRPRPAAGGLPPARVAQIRRRRVGAVILALAILVALVAILAGGSSGKSAAQRRLEKVAHAQRKPASESENHQNAAVAKVLAYTPFVRAGNGQGHDVALTFDDGPGPYTPNVLSVLEHYHVHATFFVVGKMLEYFSSSTARAVEDGDVIGNHTEDHPPMATLSARDQKEQLAEQSARVELVGGHRPVLFRPPYGSFNQTTLRELKAEHLLMVIWSTDTEDFRQPGVETIVHSALEGAQPGAIILLHDAGGNREQTVAALPQIIKGIQEKGLRLVTVPELLMDEPPPAGQPLPPNLSGG